MRKSARYISGILISSIYCTTANAEVTLDGSTGSSGDVSAVDKLYDIKATLGRQEGGNLYHSFQKFNVEPEHTANFSGPNSVQNIISRVTGGETSHIDGTLSSTIEGANLYLLNPSGVLFGADASIDISGSFHVSTADYLRMGEDDYFYTNLSQDSSFVAASPSAFGFTSETPANISVDGSTLSVLEGKTISLIGGDVNLDNGANVQASDGTINIASVASSGVVTATPETMRMKDFTHFGDASLTNTKATDTATEISTSGGSAGHIVIRGGTLTLDNGSKISANSDGSGTKSYSENIDIVTETEISLKNQSSIANDVESSSSADTKGIALETDHLILDSSSSITSNTAEDSSGNSGGLSIDSDQLTLLDGSTLQVQTNGTGNTGDINLNLEEDMKLDNNSVVESTVTSSGGGDGGDINIESEQLDILDHSAIKVSTTGSGNSGDINIESDDISIKDGGRITTSSRSAGYTGNINIESESIEIVGPEASKSPFRTDFTGISSTKNFSTPSAGGNITIINDEDITLDRRAKIEIKNSKATDGGDIVIDSGKLNILTGSRLVSDAQRATSGDGGNIIVSANEMKIAGFYDASSSSFIHIIGPHSPSLRRTPPTGDTGNLHINTESIKLLNGGLIQSISTQSTGATGSIYIDANSIRISGLNIEWKNQLIADGFSIAQAIEDASSNIKSSSKFKALIRDDIEATPSSTGKLSINSQIINMDSNTYISTATQGIGNSLDLQVTTKNLVLESGAYLTSSAERGSGNAGNITISADNILMDGENSQSRQTGVYSQSNKFASNTSGGNILIQSNQFKLTNGAIVTSETALAGNGGKIDIVGNDYVQLSNGAAVTAKASEQSTGNAGDININTPLFVLDSSEITTTAISGQGGNISISTNNLIITNDSVINASSEQSVDGTINITNYVNVTSHLVSLPEETIDVATLFKSKCEYGNGAGSYFSVTDNLLSANLVATVPSNYSGGPVYQTNIHKNNTSAHFTILNYSDTNSIARRITWNFIDNCNSKIPLMK